MYVLVWIIIIDFLFLDFTKLLDFLPGDALLQFGAIEVMPNDVYLILKKLSKVFELISF